MPPTSRKSISKAVWRIPDIPGASKAQVSSYWMDESGKMWYSGPKSGKTKSRKSNQSENVPPKPAQAAKRLFPDETSSNISKPYLALADMTVSMVDECYGDVMPTGASEQRQRRKAAGQDSLELISIDSQHIHENVGVAWSAFWQWIDSSSLVTLARLGVVVLLLVCVLEVSLRCVGVRRLSYRDETAQLYDIDIEAKPEFAETARFEGIIGLVANSVSASTYTATVDTVRQLLHACAITSMRKNVDYMYTEPFIKASPRYLQRRVRERSWQQAWIVCKHLCHAQRV